MCAVPRTLLALMLLVGSLLGCASIPSPEDPQSSAIGIRFETHVPIFGHQPSVVFFVKIENDDDLAQSQVIQSNFAKRGRLYLLNAPPGKYVAVASARWDQYGTYVTLFSKELIEATRVEVVPGKLVFMGTYFVREPYGMGNADPIQNHYASVLEPHLVYFPHLYRGRMQKGTRDDAAQAEFLTESREDFAGSGWREIIK